MKKSVILVIVALVILVGVVSVVSNKNVPNQELENKVGATIFPIYDIARQIAGNEFEVVLLLPPGASPHTFDPQPSLLKDLQGARAIFAIGYGLDDWSGTVVQSIDAPIVVVDHNIELRVTEEEHEDEHGPVDPHYWLSIHNAEQIAVNIASELSNLDSENANLYMERAEEYVRELEALEAELQGQTASLSNLNILSLHDAWYYFAGEFGLNLVGTFEPSAGKEPTPQYLANLEEEVGEHNVSTLFMEPQLSAASIQAFANDHNLRIAVIDPLGGVEGRNSYIELMRYNIRQVVNALTE